MDTKSTIERPNIALYADRVMVVIMPQEEFKTASGIIVNATDKQSKTQTGRVVRVAAGVEKEAKEWEEIKEGELVLFSEFAGSEVQYQGKDYKILRFTDIFGRIEQE